MSQPIELLPSEEQVKETIKKIATDENIQTTIAVFELLLNAWLQATAKDKQLIQILIIIVASISAFLAVAQGLP